MRLRAGPPRPRPPQRGGARRRRRLGSRDLGPGASRPSERAVPAGAAPGTVRWARGARGGAWARGRGLGSGAGRGLGSADPAPEAEPRSPRACGVADPDAVSRCGAGAGTEAAGRGAGASPPHLHSAPPAAGPAGAPFLAFGAQDPR